MQLTSTEKNWIYYDVGNSAFTLLLSTILPIYFNALAESANISSVDYLAYWGYAASIATIIVAFLGPVCGTLADTQGYKKPIFLGFIAVGLVGCVSLGFISHWLVFLVVLIITKVGYAGSLVVYDAMLTDVTTSRRMDLISAQGYAWGYIGSCLPFIIALGLVLGGGAIGLSTALSMQLAFAVTALWWLLFSVPLVRTYEQKHFVARPKRVVRESFGRLWVTCKSIGKQKKIFVFLLTFFCYIDGVYTIIGMATAYGAALGLDTTGLLLALLLTQIVAFPFAILFGKLAAKYDTAKLITICILAYFGIGVFAIFLHAQWQFWTLAVLVGMFQGGVQALSRSYYAKIIPADRSGEYFGIMDICGKSATFVGTTLVGVVSQLTGSINAGVGVIASLFLVGLVLFRLCERVEG